MKDVHQYAISYKSLEYRSMVDFQFFLFDWCLFDSLFKWICIILEKQKTLEIKQFKMECLKSYLVFFFLFVCVGPQTWETVLCGVVWCGMREVGQSGMGCGIALYCIVLCCVALRCIALHCIALHCTTLHCIVLYCIALYCIALNPTAAAVTRH